MSYDAETREFTLYSEDWDLIGDHEFTVKAVWTMNELVSINEPPAKATL